MDKRVSARYSFVFVVAALPIAAQCLVENPGGSKVNINRPRDADVRQANVSPLSEINQSLPDWLCFNAGYRARVEGYDGGGFQAGNSDSYLLTRFRLGILIKPTSWFKVYTEVQDATAFWKDPPLAPPYQSTWDLRRAYADIGNVAEGLVSLRAGRQDLDFGAGRLVGTSYWRNASRGYDAAMLVINSSWLRLNAFAASPVVPGENGLSHHQQGNDLHGVYAALKHVIPASVLEPYLLWRLSPNIKTEQGTLAKLDEKTAGVRLSGAKSRLDYDAEAAVQTGNVGTNRIRAWAAILTAGRVFDSLPLRPRLFGEYAFASGDRNPKDGTRGTFDQLYPNVHDHHGLADQVGWQNLREGRAGIRLSPRRDWMVAAVYCDWWLASATDAFYSSSGGVVARDTKGLSGSHIGEEFDVETSYRINRQLELGAGIGHMLPGSFLAQTHHNHAYTYPYLMLNYNFF